MSQKETEEEVKPWWEDFSKIGEGVEATEEDKPIETEEVTPVKEVKEEVIEEVKPTQIEEKPSDVTAFLEDAVSLLEAEGLLLVPEDKVYSPNAEGFKEMLKDNTEALSIKIREEVRAEYEQALKEQEGITKFSELDINDEEHAEILLKNYYTLTGFEEDEIADKLQTVKELGELSKDAKVAQRYLTKVEKEQEAAAEKQRIQAVKEEEESLNRYVDGIKNEIDSMTEIIGFKPDQKQKNEFKDFILKPDKNGKTEAQKLAEDPAHRLRVAWMEFIDYKKSDLEIKVRSELATNQVKKNARFQDTQASVKGTTIRQSGEETDVKSFFRNNPLWGNVGSED